MTAAPLPSGCALLPGGLTALTYARAVDVEPERPTRLGVVLDELLGRPSAVAIASDPPPREATVSSLMPRRRVEPEAAEQRRAVVARDRRRDRARAAAEAVETAEERREVDRTRIAREAERAQQEHSGRLSRARRQALPASDPFGGAW